MPPSLRADSPSATSARRSASSAERTCTSSWRVCSTWYSLRMLRTAPSSSCRIAICDSASGSSHSGAGSGQLASIRLSISRPGRRSQSSSVINGMIGWRSRRLPSRAVVNTARAISRASGFDAS